VLGAATSTTGTDGTAQVLYTVGSVAGPASISAALHDAPSVTVSFTETALAAAASALAIVSGNNQSALVGLPLPNPLVVKATDAAGRAVSGAQVDWTIVSGGGVLGAATSTTGTDGTTQVLYTVGSVAGPASISAALHNAPSVTVSFTETALAAVASALAIVSGNNQSALVGLPLTNPLVVKATDAAGRAVSGAQVDWTVVSGGGVLGAASSTTGTDGTTQVLYTVGSVAGPASITAALHNAPSVTVSFTETALAAAASALAIVSGNNQSALVGLPLTNPLVVKATDAAGRAVRGAQVDWTIVSGGGVLGAATSTTGSDGTTQVLYTVGSVAGPATIRAALRDAPETLVEFSATALPAVASALAIVSGNNQSAVVGLPLANPLVVKATDAAGRAVSGAQVDWTIVSGGGILSTATTTTGTDGTTQVLYTTGSVAGQATISAALHDAPSVTVSFTETALAAVAKALTIVSGNNQSALVGLPLANPLVVKATDAAGRAVNGARVDWSILSGGGVLGAASSTTGTDGTAQVLFTTGSSAGSTTIRATLHNASSVKVSFTETALAAVASALAIVSGDNQSALVGLPLTNPLVVKATDAAGRAVSGAQVDWTIVSGGGLLSAATTTTGADGTTQVLYTVGSVAGPASITAGLHSASSVTVSFTETALAAVASALAIVSGDNQSALVGLPLTNPLVVKATDAAGRAVSGAQVDWTIVSGGGLLSAATTTTGSDGTTQVLYTVGSVAGPASITAGLHNASSVTVSFTETALAAVASALAIVSGDNQSALVGLPLTNPLVVKATDAAGRAVSGAQVDWTIVSGGGLLSAATTTTGADGTTQVLYTVGSVAGPASISAALHNAPSVTVSFTETALAAVGSTLAIVSGNNQSALVGLPLANPLVVKATDAAGRAVSGAQVDWTIVSGGGVLGAASSTTGTDGTTQVLYTVGSVAGPASITAALHDAPSVTVSFTETALAAVASTLAIVSGNNQSATAGLPLAQPLIVKATDAAGRAVSGALVDWTIVSGGGLLSAATTTTGADGTTQVLYTLPLQVGANGIRAALHDAPEVQVLFTATGT
jgi:adhesin/invasin